MPARALDAVLPMAQQPARAGSRLWRTGTNKDLGSLPRGDIGMTLSAALLRIVRPAWLGLEGVTVARAHQRLCKMAVALIRSWGVGRELVKSIAPSQ